MGLCSLGSKLTELLDRHRCACLCEYLSKMPWQVYGGVSLIYCYYCLSVVSYDTPLEIKRELLSLFLEPVEDVVRCVCCVQILVLQCTAVY